MNQRFNGRAKQLSMFQRFNGRSRQVMLLANEETRILKQDHMGVEHLLLGLLRAEKDLCAFVFESVDLAVQSEALDITVERVRAQVTRVVGTAEQATYSQNAFTPRARQVYESSIAEADALGHRMVAPHHLLLGLLHEREGVAAKILFGDSTGRAGLDGEADAAAGTMRRRVLGRIERDSAGWVCPDVVALEKALGDGQPYLLVGERGKPSVSKTFLVGLGDLSPSVRRLGLARACTIPWAERADEMPPCFECDLTRAMGEALEERDVDSEIQALDKLFEAMPAPVNELLLLQVAGKTPSGRYYSLIFASACEWSEREQRPEWLERELGYAKWVAHDEYRGWQESGRWD